MTSFIQKDKYDQILSQYGKIVFAQQLSELKVTPSFERINLFNGAVKIL